MPENGADGDAEGGNPLGEPSATPVPDEAFSKKPAFPKRFSRSMIEKVKGRVRLG